MIISDTHSHINITSMNIIDNSILNNHIQADNLINNLKSSFKSRIEQDSIHFEHHQQQQIVQMQRSQQHSMEI